MKIQEAMKHVIEGKPIALKGWGDGRYIKLIPPGEIRTYQIRDEPYHVFMDVLLTNDWYNLENPNEKYSFVDILEPLINGNSFTREIWKGHTYISYDQESKQVIKTMTEKGQISLNLENLLSDEWEIFCE